MAHPPPPWHLFGELIIVPALRRPRALGGVLLANYTSGTLVYRELIVFSHATARGMVVSHIYVDDEQSLSGGHEIWGLPKELAEFEYTRTRFVRPPGRPRCWRRRSGAAPAGCRCVDPRADRQRRRRDARHAPASRPRPRWSRSTSRRTARSPTWA